MPCVQQTRTYLHDLAISIDTWLQRIDYVSEAKLIGAACLTTLVIVGPLIYLSNRYHWDCIPWSEYLWSALPALPAAFTRYTLPTPLDLESNATTTKPGRHICGAPTRSISFDDSAQDTTRRLSFDGAAIRIFGYPSLGGVIVLDHASIPDFEFLGLDRLAPLETRGGDDDDDTAAEDAFCKEMLRLGARWYEDLARYWFLKSVGGEGGEESDVCVEALEEGSEPEPGLGERYWVGVAWLRGGGLVVAEWDTLMWGHGRGRDEEFLPVEELARLRLCVSMDEKARVLRERFGGVELRDVGEYCGNGFLGAWEKREREKEKEKEKEKENEKSEKLEKA
ncbi:hypothetical protein BDV95DRAFT_596716 [Massariosphaeria phaeospora]|uniref:Uncharacterized protein n=1 Tax=Massariosphaeria phaeospora TaxID=100035 RepID=A0A7C8MK31_9PLEO|nr:hypothetical protein BDV95DRAFT_596716 [Massariosphaeria phaeospora]